MRGGPGLIHSREQAVQPARYTGPMSRPLATVTQLRQWAAMGAAGFSPFDPDRVLIWQAESSPRGMQDEGLVSQWLRALPCPVIAIASAQQEGAWTRASDVVLEEAAQAAPLLKNIEHSPIAATVLVQLLRATEASSIADALTAESLAYSTLQAGPEFRRWLDTSNRVATQSAPDGPAVLLDREGASLSMRLNRPSRRNAMSVEMRDALIEALRLVIADDEIRHVRLSGQGPCFISGGDLAEFGTAPDPASAHILRSLCLPGALLARCAERVTAHVHGACIGSGIEFPAFAHRIVAAPDAEFQLPELRYGLIPGAGGCVSLPRRIGRQRTARLALSGERITARTALQWGLVNQIS